MTTPTPQDPWPLRVMLQNFRDWVDRLGQVWVSGEISKIRSSRGQTYFTLRDEQGAVSADVMIHPSRFADPHICSTQRSAPRVVSKSVL